MSSSETLYWHDYETFGADPSRDRPAQFAGQRTDKDLNPVGEPLLIYARPSRDYLPHPDACLLTGITPQTAQERGLPEVEFMARIHAELAHPGTCALGYNSLRFDDEVTRYALYRNLYDPYAREFRDGNSRWDLIDAVRTAYALRPEGMHWPRREDGSPSFRLEDLTAANGIAHGEAHDALADVRATIALAQRLRSAQPRLYAHLFQLRRKEAVRSLIDTDAQQPLLHVSGMFGAHRANLGLVVPLLWHPQNRNEVICCDLGIDPTPLLELPADRLRTLLYTPNAQLPPGTARPGLKSVHINRCPVLLPAKMLDEQVAERAGIDRRVPARHQRILEDAEARTPGALRDKLRVMLSAAVPPRDADPDRQLYGGGFFSAADRSTMERIRGLSPADLANCSAVFEDPRLEEMLFRFRARNYPQSLTAAERERWDEFRLLRITQGSDGGYLDLETYQRLLDERLAAGGLSAAQQRVLEALHSWGDGLLI